MKSQRSWIRVAGRVNFTFRSSHLPIYAVMLGAAGVAATACSAGDQSGYDDPEMDNAEFPLNGGTFGPQNAALGSIRNVAGAGGSPGTGGTSGVGASPAADFKCSASLVHPEWVVTAASCLGYQTGTVNETWTPGTGAGGSQITYAHSVGTTNDAKNIAFGRLSTRSGISPASIAKTKPTQGQTVTAAGYGCIGFNNPIGGFRVFEYPYGQTTYLACSKGDEGGPRYTGTAATTPTLLWGLTGQIDGSGIDKVADLVQFGLPYQRGLTAFGGTRVDTSPMAIGSNSGSFLAASRTAGVRALAGDFDGDGFGDVALLGRPDSPSTIYVAYGGSTNGRFAYYGEGNPVGMHDRAVLAKSIVAGDFDGDGDSDFALVGNPNWTSIYVGYSTGRSGFTLQEEPGAQFATWAAVQGAYAVAADLSGDGVTDIALVGGSGWTSVPIQKRKPGGVQEVINPGGVSTFVTASQTAGASVHGARVTGTTDSLLVLGAPTSSLFAPQVRLNGNALTLSAGSTLFTSESSTWARTPGVKVVVADFTGDGLSDVAYLGPITNPLPKYLPFSLNAGSNVFQTALLPIADFPDWATTARFVLPSRRRWGLSVNDLILIDVPGAPQYSFPYAELKP